MPETKDPDKRRRTASGKTSTPASRRSDCSTGETLRGLLGALLQPVRPSSGHFATSPPGCEGSDNPVDEAQALAVESTSALQKDVSPGFVPEADEQRVWSTPPNESPTLLSRIPRVKRLPSLRPDDAPGGISMSVGENGEGGDSGGDDRGRGGRESDLPNPPGPYADNNVSSLSKNLPFFLSIKCIVREVLIFGGRFAHDEATGQNMVLSPPPWQDTMPSTIEIGGKSIPTIQRTYPRKIDHADAVSCSEWLENVKSMPVPVGLCVDALRMLASKNRFDSVRRAFSEMPLWDHVERFSLLPAILGLQPTDAVESASFSMAIGAWLIATMRRVQEPGAILDDVLFIEEAVDINGTVRAFSQLFPPGMVGRVGADFDCRYAYAEQRILGKAMIIVADFAGANAARTAELASFAVRPSDRGDSSARRCGFLVLSSSRTDFVPSEFVSVRGGEVPQPLLDPNLREQILAEAIEKIATMPVGRPSRTMHREPEDGWDVPVRRWLHREVRAGADGFTISVILRECIKLSLERQVPAHAARVGRILRACGFRRSRVRDLTTGERPSVWRPPMGFARSPEELAAFAAEAAAEETAQAALPELPETIATVLRDEVETEIPPPAPPAISTATVAIHTSHTIPDNESTVTDSDTVIVH